MSLTVFIKYFLNILSIKISNNNYGPDLEEKDTWKNLTWSYTTNGGYLWLSRISK